MKESKIPERILNLTAVWGKWFEGSGLNNMATEAL
jgi:hypothetical protein